MEIVSLFVVFERQTNEVSGWCSLFILLNFSESESLAGEALVLGKIFFFLSSVWTLDIFSFLILKTSIFIEDSLGISQLLFVWSVNQTIL